MPPVLITRTPIIDDDGSGTTGTGIDNAWKQQFYGQIDAALAALLGHADLNAKVVGNAESGTLHNWAIAGRTRVFHVDWSGSAPLLVTGIAGGVVGDRISFRNWTPNSSYMSFYTQHGGSAIGNKLFNVVSSGPASLGPGGTIAYIHNGTGWELLAHDQGAPIAALYHPSYFTGSGAMVWAVDAPDVVALNWRLDGTVLTVRFQIAASSLTGTASLNLSLSNVLFNSYMVPAGSQYNQLAWHNQPSPVHILGNGASLQLGMLNGGNFTLGTNDRYFYGEWQGVVS
jgi:hypothetical protein